jgi:hypothetical protein
MPVTREKRKVFGEAIKPVEQQDKYTVELVNHSDGSVVESVVVAKHNLSKAVCEMSEKMSDELGLAVCKESVSRGYRQ